MTVYEVWNDRIIEHEAVSETPKGYRLANGSFLAKCYRHWHGAQRIWASLGEAKHDARANLTYRLSELQQKLHDVNHYKPREELK